MHGFRIPHTYIVACAALTCGMIVFGHWLVCSACRNWIKAVSIVASGCLAHYSLGLIDRLHNSQLGVSTGLRLSDLLCFGALSLLILAAARAAQSSRSDPPSSTSERLLRIFSRLVFVLMLGMLLTLNLRLYAYMWRPLSPPEPQLPHPNAYDELVSIGNKLQLGSLNVRERNASLDAARDAMARPAQVPLRYEKSDLKRTYFDFRALNRLCISFLVESDAVTQKHQAVQYGLDCMQLGQSTAAGGIVYDREESLSFDRGAISQRFNLRNSLDSKQCQTILKRLEEIENQRESLDVVLDRTARWEWHVMDWYSRFTTYDMLRGAPSSLFSPLRCDRASFHAASENLRDAMLRLLQAELAIRAFQLDTGREPTSLEQLVPAYLSQVPLDPYDAGGPLRYRPTQRGYDCYSVGPDGRDQGGERVFLSRGYFSGDMFLSTPAMGRAAQAAGNQ